jgi:hypothetical protein
VRTDVDLVWALTPFLENGCKSLVSLKWLGCLKNPNKISAGLRGNDSIHTPGVRLGEQGVWNALSLGLSSAGAMASHRATGRLGEKVSKRCQIVFELCEHPNQF